MREVFLFPATCLMNRCRSFDGATALLRFSVVFVVVFGIGASFARAQTFDNTTIDNALQTRAWAAYWNLVKGTPETRESLTDLEIHYLFQSLAQHPVASVSRLKDHYDPEEVIGFCFGRDMAAFLLARQMGLSFSAMKSLFVVGDLRFEGRTVWRFHVAKLVRRHDNTWWVIDPAMPQGRPLAAAEWIQTIQYIWDQQKKAKLYLVSPFHVMPDVRFIRPPEQETGLDIIDLSFEPHGKSGFWPTSLFDGQGIDDLVYELSEEAAQQYFLSTTEDPREGFTFTGLQINGVLYDFRGYFFDLFASLSVAWQNSVAFTMNRPEIRALSRSKK